jgi:putative tryptophan/tyrosine transport system substrate-binding protein
MRRREFITLVGSAGVAWPLAARAEQPERMGRVGVLMGYAETDLAAQAQVAAFRQELQKLGWDEGRNIHIDVRFPAANADRVRANLRELTSLAPDVLVSNTDLVTAVVRAEVRTIPIVFISVGDAISSGYVNNEARPDGNLTGFANWDSSISGKWLELLKQVAPDVERVGFVMQPEIPILVRFFKSVEAMGPSLKVKLVPLDVRDANEIERTLVAFAAEGSSGLIVSPNAVTFSNRDLIVTLAARLGLPAIYAFAFYPKSGGLISYGFDPVNHFQHGAGYVDRILRGAKPADLPVQYPTKFQLVVNLKTAKALGLAIPEPFLLRADEVIE